MPGWGQFVKHAGAAVVAMSQLNSVPGTVVAIDDDPAFRAALVRLLEKAGYTALGAEDAAEGLALARRHHPDLVLCDLEMPKADGYEVLLAMREDALLAWVPVIFLTGRSDPTMVRFGMSLGVDDYLTKPVGAEDLLQAIHARVTRARQLRPAKPPPPSKPRAGLEDTFLVKHLNERRLIKIRQITHILAYGEYSWVYWDHSQSAMLRKGLKQWLMELPVDSFVRVHRNAIVNLEYLDRVEQLAGGRMQLHLRSVSQPVLVSLRLTPILNRRLQHR